jgi:peptidoglycan-N-acetylglucosamine deacetylase
VAAGDSYTVEEGDSLYAIAVRSGVRLRDLLSVNGFTEESGIRPGDVIRLPVGAFSGSEPAPTTTSAPPATNGTPTPGGSYTVQAGDSLFGIAQRAGVRLSDLLQLNGLTDTSPIKPGDVIRLPAGAITAPATGTTIAGTPAPSGNTYEIKAGDTLFGIAQRFGVPLQELLSVNGFTASSVITPGTRIRIPAA